MLTSRTSVSERYGLSKPYNFRVAIPFLLNLFGLSAVLTATVCLIAIGHFVTIGTTRFYFVVYLVVFFAVGALLSIAPKISVGIFIWTTIEIGLGLSSMRLASAGIGVMLIPDNIFDMPKDERFIYHALLQRVPRPNWQQTILYDGRNKNLLSWGAFTTDGFFDSEFKFTHNSIGLRGPELRAVDLQRPLIFLYGGSTTYDYTVTQGETWAEQLQKKLEGQFTILNFGVPGHSSAEHLVHTAFYQGIVNKYPVCAVYYVGWNDIQSAYVKGLDSAYANYHALRLAIRKDAPWVTKYSPAMRLAYKAIRSRADSIPEAEPAYGIISRGASDPHLEKLFIEHVTTIIAINDSRRIRSVFIGQLMNRDLLYSLPRSADYSAFGFDAGADVWSFQERFNTTLKRTAESKGALYIDAGIEEFTNSDFTDSGHFSAAGSKKFAAQIFDTVRADCGERQERSRAR